LNWIEAEESGGVFVGDTSGIGERAGLAFAKHSENPTIYIVGRNATAAENIITEVRRLNPSNYAKFYSSSMT
jgi:hypothetical protein